MGNDDSARGQRNLPAYPAQGNQLGSRILVPPPACSLPASHNGSMENELFTLRDLANHFKRFGLSLAWLKAEAEAGRIPCFRAGRKLLFDPEAVEQSLLQRARVAQERQPTDAD